MRTFVRVSVLCLAFGVVPCSVRASAEADPTAELDAAAKAFLKAYHNKDVDAMMAAADAPFLVGTVRDPKILKKGDDVRKELQSRLKADEKLAGRVAKTLTWAKAIAPAAGAEREKMRELMKPAIDITGEDGGYAALADAKGKSLAISGTRLLVGVRGGKAKVVGILADPKN